MTGKKISDLFPEVKSIVIDYELKYPYLFKDIIDKGTAA